MRIPFAWLKEYVEIFEPAEEIADEVRSLGYPVRGVCTVGAAVRGVLVGEVRSLQPHPKADLMKVCDLDLGDEGQAQIVTTAANVYVGQRVAAALHGASLADGVRIKRGKLRGVPSEGVLCSAADLGLSALELPADQRHGLIEMPEGSLPGADVLDLLGLDQKVVELAPWPGQLPGGLVGLARELAVRLERTLEPPSLFPQEEGPHESFLRLGDAPANGLAVQAFRQVKVEPSPPWMARRLRAAGVHCVNNVVDILRYVMFETGQPLHVFDLDTLGLPLEVRRCRAGEKLGDTALPEGLWVVADQRGPVAVAGVLVGPSGHVRRRTRQVLVKAIAYPPQLVSENARLLGTNTESSRMFALGVRPAGPHTALRRAAWLLQRLARCRPQGSQSWAPSVPRRAPLRVDSEMLRRNLGPVPPEWVDHALRALDERFTRTGAGPWLVASLRSPDELLADLARLRGYDRIVPEWPSGPPCPAPRGDLRGRLAALGYTEAVTCPRGEPARALLEAIRRWPRGEDGNTRLFELRQETVYLALMAPDGAYLGLKGALEHVAEVAGAALAFEPSGPAWLHPGRSARIFVRRSRQFSTAELGWIGEVHPAEAAGFPDSAGVACWDLGVWQDLVRPRPLRDPRLDPVEERDVAILVGEDVPVGRVCEVAATAGGIHVTSVRCFDVYRGSQIPEGDKSLGLRVRFATRREVEVQTALARILSALGQQLGARVRT
ncbi:MAG: phenylalanine--tRNA ligase subunit beta [Candidatus Eremiobacterota bacterium]